MKIEEGDNTWKAIANIIGNKLMEVEAKTTRSFFEIMLKPQEESRITFDDIYDTVRKIIKELNK
jgi:hypothetical protein